MKPSGQSPAQRRVNKFFPFNAIAYQPGLALVFRSVPVGIFLSQMLYWQGKETLSDGWMYKTIEEMKAETGLSRHQQNLIIKRLVAAGLIETKLAGIPAKRHFRLNLDEFLNRLPSLKQSVGVVYMNPPRQFDGKRQSITKTTQETTTKITHRNFSNSGVSPIAATIKQRAETLETLRKLNTSKDGVHETGEGL